MLHPELLAALAGAGHGTRVLVADGNYPLDVGAPLSARRIYLNVCRGLVGAAQIVELLKQTIPVEAAVLMEPPYGQAVDIQATYREILGPSVSFERRKRQAFYDEARSPMTSIVIATGEERRFANLLLTIGVIRLEGDVR